MVRNIRNRYIVYNVIAQKEISLSQIKRQIWSTYKNLYGLNGTTEAGLYFEIYNEENKLGLMRCTQQSLNNLMTVLSLISEISDVKVIICPLRVTGIIKKAKEYLSAEINTVD
ncbi:MAG: Rpp14/Pop5 family protein [Candidatus Heimdallarchaeaceae archaeon]